MSRSVVLLLQEHLETIRRGEIDRLFRRLQLGVEEKNAVDALSRSIVDRVMQTPVSMLTAAPQDAGTESLARSASRLFNLGQEDR
jgi:glutamyl-tRNA reductase